MTVTKTHLNYLYYSFAENVIYSLATSLRIIYRSLLKFAILEWQNLKMKEPKAHNLRQIHMVILPVCLCNLPIWHSIQLLTIFLFQLYNTHTSIH